jgi:hypothetical protein
MRNPKNMIQLLTVFLPPKLMLLEAQAELRLLKSPDYEQKIRLAHAFQSLQDYMYLLCREALDSGLS